MTSVKSLYKYAFKNISTKELKLKHRPNQLIDVRSPNEYKINNIKEILNLELDQINVKVLKKLIFAFYKPIYLIFSTCRYSIMVAITKKTCL